ncbi:MAG: hypothetical protein V3R20_03515 [Sphingomonadales bacterium]
MRNKISAWGVLKDAYATFGKEKGLFAALAILLSILTLVLLSPAIDAFRAAPGMWDPGQQFTLEEYAIFLEKLAYLKYWIWPFLFINYGALVLWSRATVGGTGVIYYGGGVALFGRTIWAIWRMLGAMLIAAILGGLFYAFSAFFLVIIGLSAKAQGLPLDNPVALFESIMTGLLPFYVIFVFGLQMVAFLQTFAIHGQSRDIHTPLYRSFQLMKKNLFRATGVFFLLALVYQVIFIAFFVTIAHTMFTASFWVAYFGFFILFIVAFGYQLLAVSYGAIYAHRLIPELQEED